MSNDTFTFLKEEFNDLYQECNEFENLIINGSYNAAIIQSRKIMEIVINQIYELENKLKYLPLDEYDLNTKITILLRRRLINSNFSNYCHDVRKRGNKAAHDNLPNAQAMSFEAHQDLYYILKIFYENYSQKGKYIDIEPYSGIDLGMDDEKIRNMIQEIMSGANPKDNKKDDVNNNDSLDNYQFYQIDGSYLLGELTRLKNSSQEAVEGYEGLSIFKKYLHIKRDIQDELENKLKETVSEDKNKLILLCGSVGDGKSHLLSYFNENKPELMNNFEIINDATESSDPKETSIDRLLNRLSDFDDNNINKNNKKIILSINLGILNNFIDSKGAKERYTVLSSILNDLNIFDVNDFSQNFDKEPVSVISFSDNNLFEFDENADYGVSSKYISELFNKITQQSDNNPFYRAYQMDLDNTVNTFIHYNYSLLSKSNVQNIIINNIIKIVIKYKKIISTRELLNFIYEITVPSSKSQYDVENYLPNLLFNTVDGCEILKIINYEDPVYKRSSTIDQILMDLNVNNNILSIISSYMDSEYKDIIKNTFDSSLIIRKLDVEHKDLLTSTLIRYLNLFGTKEIIDLFTKKSYKSYVNYLNNYNTGNIKGLIGLKNEIEQAIFTWKGDLGKNNLCIYTLDNFKISKSFKLALKSVEKSITEKNINRFKTVMQLYFSVDNSNPVGLNIDYGLYEVITKLNKGYKPNKSEQKDLLLFSEFIDELISSSSSSDYLIYNIKENKYFDLTYEELLGNYCFEGR